MKNSIQFSHFRKFENFPKLDFNDITFIVGKNNSGKSTFVKAFVMVYNYLRSGNIKSLDLNHGSVELLNIVTFDRALCKTMAERETKFFIPITVNIGLYEFYLEVTGNEDSTILDVKEFKVIDFESNFTLKINPQNNVATISYAATIVNENDVITKALKERDDLEKAISKLTDTLSKDSIELNISLQKVTKIIDNFSNPASNIKTSFSVEEYYVANNFPELLEDVFGKLETRYFIHNPNVQLIDDVSEDLNPIENNSEKSIISDIESTLTEEGLNDEFDNLRYFYLNRYNFDKFFKSFISFLNVSEIFYLPATLNKQSALLSIRDKNNDLADVVHKYYQLNLKNDPIIHGFVKKWLNEFQIGADLNIELINGEAYSIDLIENDLPIPLADKGMGSIQAVLLILRLATVIHLKQGISKKDKSAYFVIVEEPELNLHPALQSKLCDLFFEVYDKYKSKFIIETHSEYIIRRSQVLNASMEFALDNDDINPTPFSTLYFSDNINSGAVAYSMNYQLDGTFEKAFGEGFFDASSSSTLELIRLKRKKQL